MSTIIDEAVTTLNQKLPDGFDGVAMIDIAGEGTILVDGNGARAGEGPAEVTLTADAETFRGMLEGAVDPMSAFMSGQLKVDGDMGAAMRLGAAFE